MKLRKATIRDVNRLYDLINKTREVHVTDHIYSKRLIKDIIRDKTVYLIVAEEKKKVVGFTTIAIWEQIGVSYWDMIVVDKDYRDRKIARKLYEKVLDYLKKKEVTYMWTIVRKDNKRIQKVLNKFNLKKRGEVYYYDKEIK